MSLQVSPAVGDLLRVAGGDPVLGEAERGRPVPWVYEVWSLSPKGNRPQSQTGTRREQLSTSVGVPANTHPPFTCLLDCVVNFLGLKEESEAPTVPHKK